jgi:secreted trypsin-like serine protease
MQTILVAFALAIVAGLGNTQDLPPPGVCGISTIQPKTSRIVNGEAVIPHSRPYQLLLVGFFPNGTAKYYCGGSLISSTHVLTAAHCVDGNEAKDLRIFVGLQNFTSAVLQVANGIPIRAYYKHESYNARTLANDVAVARLQIPVTVDNVKVGLVCLTASNGPVCESGNPVVASGWGSTTGDPNRPSSSRPYELQQVALQCVDSRNADCKSLTYTLGIFQDRSKICAYAANKGVCFGDSGGPLVRERTLSDGTRYVEQVGIMSGTVDCSFTKPRPDIYADVRYFSAWILNKVKASP